MQKDLSGISANMTKRRVKTNKGKAFTRFIAGVMLFLIKIYQKTLSPLLSSIFGSACACRFYPSCSNYAAEAIRVHGVIRGSALALVRLLKCTPLHPGGIDPVPPAKGGKASAPSCNTLCNHTHHQ